MSSAAIIAAGITAATAIGTTAYGALSAPSTPVAPPPPTIVAPTATGAATTTTAVAPTAPVAPTAGSSALSIDQQRQAAAAQALSGRQSTIMTQDGQGTNDTLG